jgi:hypothetical protein
MKKLIWTLLAALTSSAVAAIWVRLLARAWRRVMEEPPPERPRWARFLASPLKKQVTNRVEPAAG